MRVAREDVDKLAQAVISQLAPDEAPYFGVVSAVFHAASARGRHRAARRRDSLAFGVETIAIALTPVVIAVSAAVLEGLATEYADRAGQTIWQKITRRPGKRKLAGPAVALTPEQLARVRSTALRTASELDVPDKKASEIADRIVANLATGWPLS